MRVVREIDEPDLPPAFQRFGYYLKCGCGVQVKLIEHTSVRSYKNPISEEERYEEDTYFLYKVPKGVQILINTGGPPYIVLQGPEGPLFS